MKDLRTGLGRKSVILRSKIGWVIWQVYLRPTAIIKISILSYHLLPAWLWKVYQRSSKMTSKEDYLKNWGFENSFKKYSVSLELDFWSGRKRFYYDVQASQDIGKFSKFSPSDYECRFVSRTLQQVESEITAYESSGFESQNFESSLELPSSDDWSSDSDVDSDDSTDDFAWFTERSTVESKRSSKGWKRTIRDESRRSLDQSRRSLRKQTIFRLKQTIFWGKADDLWVKADDPEGKQTIRRAESGRSYLKFLCVKADDLKGWKRTILSEIFMRESRRSQGLKADDPIL